MIIHSFIYLNVDVANQMISQIIAHIHFFDFTIFIFAFNKDIFEEIIIMLLHFLIGHIGNHCRNENETITNREPKKERLR